MSENDTTATYDVVVIGAGAAGLVTAIGSAGLGARAALIEKDRFGGECLWTGCVPSKALIRTTRTLQDARRAHEVGLQPTELDFEFAQVMGSMREVIARIQPHDDPATVRDKGVEPIHGAAEILASGHVAVGDAKLQAKRIVIATGSRPLIPRIDGLQKTGYLTHETILQLDRRPDRLLILGAGPIGLEFAQIMRRLGTEVTVIELMETILPREDAEVTTALREALESEGINFLLGHKAVAATREGDACALVLQRSDGSQTRVCGDEILVATGMRPHTEGLGLENVGVEIDRRGAVKVDSKLRTTVRGIWAAGDVTGILYFTHVADYQARTLVRNMFFPFPASADYRRVPWAVYTDPTLARVGLTEEEARIHHGDGIGVYRYSFADLDRAITDRDARGLVKIITCKRGKIRGAHILSAHADALIHEIVLAMQAGVKIGGLSRMVHAYPTWPEAIRRTADSYYREKFAASRFRRLVRWWVRR
ncbi:MAG: FAD-dependent oxidoreductase [Gemmatimonadetes bacterium]|nr:FAD-dependent oxidoreductase [Gemmatimonadota bacterium]